MAKKKRTPHPIAPIVPATFTPGILRLPVGVVQDDPGGYTMWRLWLPTNTGGIIRIGASSATDLTLKRPLGTVGASHRTEIIYKVDPGVWGEFYVVSVSADPSQIIFEFTQTAWARESQAADAPPLLPWNFWYWPSRRGQYFADRAQQVMGRYAAARGRAPDSSAGWESENHERDDAKAWAGHCHNAAPASALFEPPVAVTIAESGIPFPTNEEEIELLATEYFGSYGNLAGDWELVGDPSLGDRSVAWYFKPGQPKTKAALIEALTDELADEEGPAAMQVATALADQLVSEQGGEPAFTKKVETLMGSRAATFYADLIKRMKGEGHPLLANARSYDGSDGPEPVWNQVFFYYYAHYEETGDHGDDHDITISCRLYSNVDSYESKGLPAIVEKGVVKPGEGGTRCQVYRNVWRIIFDGAGEMVPSDARCAWKSLMNEHWQQLYAPTSLLYLLKPSVRRQDRSPNRMGNPVIGHELLKYVKLRARYR